MLSRRQVKGSDMALPVVKAGNKGCGLKKEASDSF